MAPGIASDRAIGPGLGSRYTPVPAKERRGVSPSSQFRSSSKPRPISVGQYDERKLLQAPDFTLIDQHGDPWTLTENIDAAVALIFLRGDW